MEMILSSINFISNRVPAFNSITVELEIIGVNQSILSTKLIFCGPDGGNANSGR